MKKRRWMKGRKPWTKERYRKGIYIIPSSFTVSNIFCGFFSVSSAVKGNYELAGLLIGIAMILDTLDGRMARLTHTTSEFGLQLDSLADVITFGMAPAVLCYLWAFYNFEGSLSIDRAGWLVSFLFLICAASRLARFNVQTTGIPDKRYFTGMPTPPAAGAVAATVYCFPDRLQGDVPAIAVLFGMGVLAFLMISRIKYRSFKDLNLRQPRSFRAVVIIALIIVGIALDPKRMLITLAGLYALSGIAGYLWTRFRKPVAAVEKPAELPPPNVAEETKSGL
jgi:CDP-diacylglycerol--serine O-phosphatidyltransferase